MPPKPANATTTTIRQTGRAFKKSIRKSIPKSNSTSPMNSPPPSSTAAVTPLGTASPESRSIRASNGENTPQKQPVAASPASQGQPQSSRKTLTYNSGFVSSDMAEIGGNRNGESIPELQRSGIEQVGPERIIHVETETVVGSGDESKDMANLSPVPSVRPHLQDEGSVKPVIGPESGVDGVARPGNGKRKIVKKVVRVVKKVIKKRVPKRVLINDSENQGLMAKAKESEVTKNLNFGNDGIEQSNSVDEVIEEPSTINEAKETLCISDDTNENLNLVNDGAITEPIIGEEGTDKSGIVSMETETFGANAHQSGVSTSDTNNIKSNDVITCVPDSIEVENANYIAENVMETEDVADNMMENLAKDTSVENQEMYFVNKADVGLEADRTVGLVREEDGVLVGSTFGKPKSADAEAENENDSIRLNEGLIVSGEMEVLELKKRQGTEIFVGGLDNNTKGDDIRKVFEEVGVVLEVRLVMSGTGKSGKNRGFAFVRFATSDDAKNALTKYPSVEICGKQCSVAPVGGNDTLFLGNIDRNWKTKDVVALLEKAGIRKIDKVTLKADLKNVQKNRGFAFLQLKTNKDAQIAFDKLQKKDAFGKNMMVKVAWAQPLTEPDEEEILKGSEFSNHVSFAKSNPKSKPVKRMPDWTSRQPPKAKPNAIWTSVNLHEATHKGKPSSSSYNEVKTDNGLSTTDELVQILRQQALNKNIPPHPHPRTGTNAPDLHFPIPGSKRPFSQMGYDPLYVEAQGLSRARVESSYPFSGPSSSSRGVNVSSFPYHPQQSPGLTSESVIRRSYASNFQERERAPYYGDNNIYRRY